MSILLLGFPEYEAQAHRLATTLGCDWQRIDVHHFPDEESLVSLPTELPEHVIILRSLDHPNNKLIELFFTAQTARQLGAKRLSLVAPYLAYMRQDAAMKPGQAISQQIIGALLAQHFDDVITVDPHLHRINHLNQAIPLKNAISLSAADLIADFLARQFDHALLIGPDSESEQWVSQVAQQINFDFAVCQKIREGDKQVRIQLPDRDFSQKTIILIDDMASTGRTLCKASQQLVQRHAAQVNAIVTHGLFSQDAEDFLQQSGIQNIWSTDSISHHSNRVELAPLLASAIQAME
ncbi:MAG: ribose-phosphate diphosphokinase [Gammaproteobacteria bacterium]|nr:ribose-phosphate diphosphokinase [Gammaproteobacteria bacterium]MDH5730210.1 ribose-phosphate diphosphokinase [Gammaproteobacteria bacterium]